MTEQIWQTIETSLEKIIKSLKARLRTINVTDEEVKVMSSELKVIYVGRKPPMNYVLGIMASFAVPNVKEVTLKARG